jgi:hypothetical protein
MNFALDSNYRYNGGMYLGVHIPSEHCNDEEVTVLVTAGRKAMKKYNLINGIVSTLLCFVCFVNLAVFTLIYLVWIFAYIGGEQFIEISSHRKMYALKMKNGWIVEAQKRKRYVDTKVSADAGNTHIKGWIHILLAVIQTGLFIPFLTDTGSLIFEMMLAIYLCTLLISLIAIISHYAVGRIEKNIYSTDSELNLKINVTKKKYMCISLLVMNVVNTLAWGYFAISEAIAGTVVIQRFRIHLY